MERAAAVWKELTPGREPHWLGYRPSSLAYIVRQLAMSHSRIFERVSRRIITMHDAGVS